jgi:hypothetical protein
MRSRGRGGRGSPRRAAFPGGLSAILCWPKERSKFLARFEKGNSLRWHFDSGSCFWIACDARSPLARVEASEAANFHLVAGSKGADDAVKYRANDCVGFVVGQLNNLVNPFGQIGLCHLAQPLCITKKSTTVLGDSSRMVRYPEVEAEITATAFSTSGWSVTRPQSQSFTLRRVQLLKNSMPIAPRTRWGPYETTQPLGAGGMGEAYKARDIEG